MSGTENTGFFGVIKGAIIQNLHLSGVTVTGGKRVGGLVGWAQAELDSEDMGKSIACLIGTCTVSGSVRGVEQVGGLVGLNDGAYDKDTLFSIASAIDKCTADASVTQTGADPLKLGGLVGQNLGTITNLSLIHI